MRRIVNEKKLQTLYMLELVVWIGTMLIGWWLVLNPFETAYNSAVIYLSILSLVFGIRMFWSHGARVITATGLFNLSTAMFVGFTGLVLRDDETLAAQPQFLALAIAAGVTAQILTSAIANPGHRSATLARSAVHAQEAWTDEKSANWLVKISLAILLIATAMQLILPTSFNAWIEATAFTAICVLAAGVVARENVRFFSLGTLTVTLALVLYSEWFHSGSGRLRIVALACAVVLIFAARFKKRRLKAIVVLAMPIILTWLAQDRLAHQESQTIGASAGRTGLESMITPLRVFSQLIEAVTERTQTLSHGENLLSIAAIFVPESLWPNQPRALGYELVQIYSPERYGPDSIYSVVATSTGEAFYNFGWFGIPLVSLVSGLFLRLLDHKILQHFPKSKSTALQVLGFVLLAILAGSIGDYTWSGTHTYVARLGTRLPVFALVVALACLRQHSAKLPLPSKNHALHRRS